MALPETRVLEKLLKGYARYYNIDRETPAEPFQAEAAFRVHGENYFLFKAAKYAEMDSREYVFFAVTERLDAARLDALDARAWQLGLERTVPGANHRNTDVILYIIAGEVTEEAAAMIPKKQHYKSYRFGIRGWNNYKLAVCACGSGAVYTNQLGRQLEKSLKEALAG